MESYLQTPEKALSVGESGMEETGGAEVHGSENKVSPDARG